VLLDGAVIQLLCLLDWKFFQNQEMKMACVKKT
jgi:hypothetical protein